MKASSKAVTLTPTLTPVVKETLVEQASARLIDLIAAGHWKQGERLPPEQTLCRSLGIGRSTLREAINSLVFLGLIQVRRGEGCFVGSDSTRLLDRFLLSGLLRTERDIEHLSETRMVLECELASLCAQRCTASDIAALEKLENAMERGANLSIPDFVDIDLQFHLKIASASSNPVLAQLLRTIRGLLQEWIVRSQTVARAREDARRGHAGLLAAFVAHDPKAARAEMKLHLEKSYEFMREASLGVQDRTA